MRENGGSRWGRRAGACGRLPAPSGAVGSVREDGCRRPSKPDKAAGWRWTGIFLPVRRQPCRVRRRRRQMGEVCPQKRLVLRISGRKAGLCPQIGPVLRISGRGKGSPCTKRGLFAHGETKFAGFDRRILFLVVFRPAGGEVGAEAVFLGVGLGLVENGAGEFVGEEFEVREVAGEVVGVFVAVGVAEVLHQLRGRVAQVERHGGRLVLLGGRKGLIDRQIGGIALGGAGKVHGALAQRDARLRHADGVDDAEGRVRQQQGVGIRQADILGGEDAEPPGDEEGILAAVQHARHPVNRRIGIGPAHALDKGGNDVVMHLAALVIDGHILLQALRDRAVVNDDGIALAQLGIDHDLQDIQQFAGISAAVAEERLRLPDLDLALLQHLILAQRAVEELLQVGDLEGLQHEHLAAGQKGSDHLKGGILRRGADQHDGARFHGAQQGILLRLVEAVDLIDEEDRRARLGEERLGLGRVDDFADFLHTGADRRESIEFALQTIGDNPGQRGLSHARRTPQNEGRQSAGVHHVPQDASGADQMLLTDVIGQGFGPHSLRKGR